MNHKDETSKIRIEIKALKISKQKLMTRLKVSIGKRMKWKKQLEKLKEDHNESVSPHRPIF